jgi:hypothetical protein
MDGEGELTKCVGDMAGVITAEATMVELEDAKIDAGAGAGAGAGAVMVPVLVAAEAAPAMKCTYTATHAGKLGTSVKVFGQHVAGSPFEVQTAVEPPFDYGFTHLYQGLVASGEGNRRVTSGAAAHKHAIATPGISEGVTGGHVLGRQVPPGTRTQSVGLYGRDREHGACKQFVPRRHDLRMDGAATSMRGSLE